MENEKELGELWKLNERISDECEMIGWLCTVHSNKVYYQNNPTTTKKVQDQLDKASTLISLVYIWALMEEHGFTETNKWLNSYDKLELKAWKHIRHTGAHAPGSRAKIYYKEFNEFMSSDYQGESLLKKNCKYDANSIQLANSMNYYFFQFIQRLIMKAIGHCANCNLPKD